MTPDTAVLTTGSSVQASPEPLRALDEDLCPTPFQLPESIISRETSQNSQGQSVTSNPNVIPETPGVSTSLPKTTSLIRRISSRASRTITNRRRQSSATPHSRDTSVGPCLLRRRSDSNTTAPPDFPIGAIDSESDADERDDLPSLRIALGHEGAVRSPHTPSTPASIACSSTTSLAGPVIPLELQRGTWVTKVSKKSRPKRVCLVFDADSSRLLWDKKRPNKFVHLDDIMAVRSGSDVQQYGLDLNMSGVSNLFTVIYSAPKRENKIMHLITESPETCNVWTAFLDAMLKHRQELMISLMSFDDNAIAQYWQSEMSRQFGDQPRSGEVEELDIAAVKRVCQKLHIHSSSLIVERNFHFSDARQRGRLNFAEFLTFVRRINQRPDVQRIIRSIARDPELGITLEEFLRFVQDVQGEDISSNRLLWEKKFALLSRRPKGEAGPKPEKPELQRMSEAAFVGFLTSKQNSPLLEEPQLFTLDRPMNEYFISSSHNTYLLGRQVKGRSSVEGYIAALVQGCRCVEVDCWDGPDGQPQVVHGRTLTTAISFREVMTTISKYAFVKTLFPLWISLEVHCNPTQQAIMAEIIKESFGSRLVTEPLDPESDKLPSPSQLMERILIKVKKPRPREEPVDTEPRGRRRGNSLNSTLNSPRSRSIFGDSSGFSPSQSLPQSPLLTPSHSSRRLVNKARVNTITEGEVPVELLNSSNSDNESGSEAGSAAHSSNSTVRVLGELGVYCAGVKFQGFDMPDAKNYNHIFSFMESSFAKNSREDKMALDLHNMRYLMRVYPDGIRLGSSNFDPLIYWRRGVQMVALNWQTNDIGMQLNRAMFEGGTDSSGYVLKPKELRDIQILPFNLDIAEGKKERSVVSFNIDVLSAQQLMRPANLASNKAMNPYIEIEVFDGRAFGRKSETRLSNMLSTPLKVQTEVVRENGFNPMFNNGQFPFRVVTKHPEFVFVKFTVKLSANGESHSNKDSGVASWTVKVCNLRQGYRTLPLENDEGVQYLFSSLFCKIRVDPIQKTYVEDLPAGSEGGKFKSLGGKMFNRINTSPRSTIDKSTAEKSSFDS
ncbi:unnamed protein product [Clonostachys solani]|uniref:Phosphoinositide phospholipase C n=1 Tax=Clonostachys solani TaxID=160281 RepID=A0A9N9YTR0_9HYPO|nr:unnamed protein product [Clonostachys solani]